MNLTPRSSYWIRKFGWCLMVVCVVLASPARASAEEPSPTELAVARRLFNEAAVLEKEERWAEAALKVREAIRIKDTPGLRFHLAFCEEHMGLLVEAMNDYERARDLIAGGMAAKDVEAMLPDKQKALSRRVPSIVIVPPAGVSPIRASIDGQNIASSVLGRPAPVNPGIHRVVVSAEGYRDFVADVTLTEGERRVVTAKLGRAASAKPGAAATAPKPPPAKLSQSSPITARTYVLVGEVAVTAASLAVGVTFLVAGSSADERVTRYNESVDRVARENGVTPPVCSQMQTVADVVEACADLATAVNDRDRYELLSTIGFVGAGVSALATLGTFVFWPEQKSVAVAPYSDGSGFGVGARVAF